MLKEYGPIAVNSDKTGLYINDGEHTVSIPLATWAKVVKDFNGGLNPDGPRAGRMFDPFQRGYQPDGSNRTDPKNPPRGGTARTPRSPE